MNYKDTILADAPVLFYESQEPSGLVMVDSSGNALDGDYAASGITYGVAGPVLAESGKAVTLDGVTGRGRLILGLTGANRPTYPFAIEAWAKPTPSPARASDWVLNLFAADSTALVGIGVGNLGVWDAEILQGVEAQTLIGPVATGGWQHLVMRVLGDNERRFSVDGVEVAVGTTSVSWLGTGGIGSAFTLSVGSDGGGLFFDGSVFGAAYYNADLSPTRIAAHYKAGVQSHSLTINLADAVVDELNAAPAGTFRESFTAVRRVMPTLDTSESTGLMVTVVPRAVTAANVSRVAAQFDVDIDVGIQKKLDPGNDDLDQQVPPLCDLAEQIALYLSRRSLPGLPGVRWSSVAIDPIYSADHLSQLRYFTSIVTLTYKSLR